MRKSFHNIILGDYMNMKARFEIAGALFILLICGCFFIMSARQETSASVQPDSLETVVIIDAGHGGEDGGAVAADGTEEQHINLSIAKLLEEQLHVLGIQTAMTRTDENSIHDADKKTIRERKVSDIHNRMAILDNTPNAILVSIHQNKFADTSLWGTQVFYSPNTTSSPALAQCIQESVQTLLQPENKRQIKKSGSSIYLLYNAKKTAVLVECGFLSNPKENEQLKDESYREKMAFSIAMGILEYLKE